MRQYFVTTLHDPVTGDSMDVYSGPSQRKAIEQQGIAVLFVAFFHRTATVRVMRRNYDVGSDNEEIMRQDFDGGFLTQTKHEIF